MNHDVITITICELKFIYVGVLALRICTSPLILASNYFSGANPNDSYSKVLKGRHQERTRFDLCWIPPILFSLVSNRPQNDLAMRPTKRKYRGRATMSPLLVKVVEKEGSTRHPKQFTIWEGIMVYFSPMLLKPVNTINDI